MAQIILSIHYHRTVMLACGPVLTAVLLLNTEYRSTSMAQTALTIIQEVSASILKTDLLSLRCVPSSVLCGNFERCFHLIFLTTKRSLVGMQLFLPSLYAFMHFRFCWSRLFLHEWQKSLASCQQKPSHFSSIHLPQFARSGVPA
jgi:hypothetical protein